MSNTITHFEEIEPIGGTSTFNLFPNDKIKLESISNFRSLGGLPIGSGGEFVIRPGAVNRTASPTNATISDEFWLLEVLKIKTLIDFRTTWENKTISPIKKFEDNFVQYVIRKEDREPRAYSPNVAIDSTYTSSTITTTPTTTTTTTMQLNASIDSTNVNNNNNNNTNGNTNGGDILRNTWTVSTVSTTNSSETTPSSSITPTITVNQTEQQQLDINVQTPIIGHSRRKDSNGNISPIPQRHGLRSSSGSIGSHSSYGGDDGKLSPIKQRSGSSSAGNSPTNKRRSNSSGSDSGSTGGSPPNGKISPTNSNGSISPPNGKISPKNGRTSPRTGRSSPFDYKVGCGEKGMEEQKNGIIWRLYNRNLTNEDILNLRKHSDGSIRKRYSIPLINNKFFLEGVYQTAPNDTKLKCTVSRYLLFNDKVGAFMLMNHLNELGLYEMYRLTLLYTQEELLTILRILKNKDNYPIMYFCSLGKDRTGMVTALLLSCLGVSRDIIVEDYAKSENNLSPFADQIKRYFCRVGLVKEEFVKSPREVMSNLLNWVDETYGGISNYLEIIGFTLEEQEELRRNLIVTKEEYYSILEEKKASNFPLLQKRHDDYVASRKSPKQQFASPTSRFWRRVSFSGPIENNSNTSSPTNALHSSGNNINNTNHQNGNGHVSDTSYNPVQTVYSTNGIKTDTNKII